MPAMSLDKISTDPIVSPENTSFDSPSCSCRPPHELDFQQPTPDHVLPTERDHLVAPPRAKKPFYRPRPLWLVPFALVTALSRGMTVASRIEVFTELSCNQLHDTHTSNIVIVPTMNSLLPPACDAPEPQHLGSAFSTFPTFPSTSFLADSQGDGVMEGDDPRVVPGKRCVSDPAVQARAAQLQTTMTMTMGILSALTTGWWGRFSERYGRTRLLSISVFGFFVNDLIFILVSTPHNPLASHSHRLLILAPAIEGLLGGWSAVMSAQTAYIADCTSPGSRATIFARFTGVLSAGLALGPTIGAWLIRNPIGFLRVGPSDHPLQSVNSVFWVAVACTFVNFILVSLVLPESLPADRRAANRNAKKESSECNNSNGAVQGTFAVTRIFKGLLTPLAVFLPCDVPVVLGSAGEAQGQVRMRKDWSLTFLAMSVASFMLASGVFQVKYLYAEHIYGWSAETLSYYISFLGAIRASYLLLFLPSLLATLKPIRSAVSPAVDAPTEPSAAETKPPPSKAQLSAETRFDLLVLRCSLLVELCSHVAVVLAPLPSCDPAGARWSEGLFVGATSLACAGAGAMPAVQSFALCTLQGRALAEKQAARARAGPGAVLDQQHDAAIEPGKLLGALAVAQATASAILGPVLFGVMYSTTVAAFPRTVFVLAAGLVLLSVALTFLIKPAGGGAEARRCKKPVCGSARARRTREEETRGRSRASKDLRGGAACISYGATRYGHTPSSSQAGGSSRARPSS